MKKFNHKAKRFSKLNLAYLAHCAKLAYCDKATIGEELQKLNLDTSADRYFISDADTDTQVFIAGDNKKIIISFRGTEGTKIDDWATDARIFKETWTDNNPLGEVHKGFYRALESVWDEITAELNLLRTNNQSVWITGHSLGGALAVLAGATLSLQQPEKSVNGIYTFGQPRIANASFTKNYNNKLKNITFRFVNNNDVVTRVPPQIFGYSHVGHLMYFDHRGKLYSDNKLSWWARFWDRLEGRYDDIFDLTPDGIGDHSMSIYQSLSESILSR